MSTQSDSSKNKTFIFHNVPQMPMHFLGREVLVERMVARLLTRGTLALSADGKPGVGKTTLAVALAHHPEVQQHFSDGILWAGLGQRADVMSAQAAWADALGLDITQLPTEAERAQALRNHIGLRHLLLIIDDAWDIAAARHLRCGGPNCCHLLTTRDQTLARQFSGVNDWEAVPSLGQADALELLQTFAPEACTHDPTAAGALVQASGGLPLVLELLGGYLAAPENSIFPELSHEAMTTLADPRERLKLAQQRIGSHQQAEVTLRKTIDLSLSELPSPAIDAFLALGAFAPKPATFSREAAKSVTRADDRTLAVLLARNMLDMEGDRLTLHQTLHDFAHTHPQADEEAITRHRDYYLAQVNADREDWRHIEKIYEQLQWAWNNAPGDETKLDLIFALRIYQTRQGLWQDQIDWINAGIQMTQNLALRKDEGTLLNNIGSVYDSLGQRNEALRYYQQALPIREEVTDRVGVAQTLNNIGEVYRGLGQPDEALHYYQQALPIWEKAGDHAGLAATLNNIGLVYDHLGQRDEALRYYQQALPIWEEVGDRAGLATTLNNIGLVYRGLGQPDKALRYYQQALPIREEVGDRAGQAATLNNIGLVYNHLGQRDEALRYFQQALSIREEVGDRAGLATTLNNIGRVYHNLGQRDEALRYYQQSLPITEEVGDRYGESIIRYNMAIIYRDEGNLAEAVVQLRWAIELSKAVQSPHLERFQQELTQLETELKEQGEDS